MELLIQFIVWLLKQLFGEVEPPADISRSQRPLSRPPTQRGSYMYGDEQPTQAKSLEQILEEVRQAAAQKRAQDTQPVQPARPVQPRRTAGAAPAQPRAAASREQRTLRRSLEPSRLDTTVVTPAPPDMEPQATARPLEDKLPPVSTLPSATPVTAPVVVSAGPAGAEPLAAVAGVGGVGGVSGVSGVAEIISPAEATAALAKRAAAPATAAGGALGILSAIRQAAPKQKCEVARQAIVLNEIFGPPRARRARGVGRRVF